MARKINRSQGKRKVKPNIYQLTRIIIYLEEKGTPSHLTQIVKDTLINYYYVKPALGWLLKHGLIKRKRERVYLYYRNNHSGKGGSLK